MSKKVSPFGEYLKQLIKEAGLTQTDFYLKLGITKPYFYDILSGKVNPPPPKLQFAISDILQLTDDKSRAFYDLAAEAREEIPADIFQYIQKNPDFCNVIRDQIKLTTSVTRSTLAEKS